MEQDKIISTLNDLLSKNYDAEKGYKEAAEDVHDGRLKQFFLDFVQQRYTFGHDIKAEIQSLGGTPVTGATVASGLHRAWMELKKAVSSNTEKAILEECHRGEENALAHYREALDHVPMPESTRMMLRRHEQAIEQAIRRIDEMVHLYENVS